MSGGAVRRESGSWLFVLLLFAFGFFGLFWGTFAVLLADLSGALGLSPGPLRRCGGFDPGHGPSRADRRPVGPPPVLGSLGGRIRGWYRRAGAHREL